MSEENEKDRDQMRRFTPGRGRELENHLESTEAMLAHTRAFLNHLAESEEESRRYVEQLKESLENDHRRLEKERLRLKENETD